MASTKSLWERQLTVLKHDKLDIGVLQLNLAPEAGPRERVDDLASTLVQGAVVHAHDRNAEAGVHVRVEKLSSLLQPRVEVVIVGRVRVELVRGAARQLVCVGNVEQVARKSRHSHSEDGAVKDMLDVLLIVELDDDDAALQVFLGRNEADREVEQLADTEQLRNAERQMLHRGAEKVLRHRAVLFVACRAWSGGERVYSKATTKLLIPSSPATAPADGVSASNFGMYLHLLAWLDRYLVPLSAAKMTR